MFKINAWIKDKEDAVRYVRQGFETIEEVLNQIELELKDIEVLEVHITKEI